MLSIFWLLFAYFLGSLPFGLIVAKISKGIDPRVSGSCNTGATNVSRLCGVPWGILVLILDIAKGTIPVAMAAQYSDNWAFLGLVGLCAILGHAYSIFLDMKGGKAVATTIGVFLAIAPVPLVWAVVACILVIWLSGYVSMGSMTFAVTLPAFCLLTANVSAIPLALVAMALMVNRHKENVHRLARGLENGWYDKK